MKSITVRAAPVVGALLLLCTAGRTMAQGDLLMMRTTVPPEADRWYQNHYADSMRTNFEAGFARVFTAPEADARVLGGLSVVARWDDYLHFAWAYRPAGSGESVVWREDVGDWGYGIDQFVVDTVEGWVELPPGPYGGSGWVRLLSYGERDGFVGEVYSIAGRLVRLDSVDARAVGSAVQHVVSGTMMIESIVDSTVSFRPEVPSDMPCRPEEEGTPDPEVPHYRSALSNFVTTDRKPRFVIAYPKGC